MITAEVAAAELFDCLLGFDCAVEAEPPPPHADKAVNTTAINKIRAFFKKNPPINKWLIIETLDHLINLDKNCFYFL